MGLRGRVLVLGAVIASGCRLSVWGANGAGQLGDGTTTDRPAPVDVTLAPWTSVDAGGSQTCGIRHGGTLWCWGWNFDGQVGDGTQSTRSTPTRIGTASHWLQVSAGDQHTCGIRSGGTVWCWGFGEQGQVGDGDQQDNREPYPVYLGAGSVSAVSVSVWLPPLLRGT